MDIQKQIEFWKSGALESFDTAMILLKKRKYLHGLFFCHLSIEKVLKAHVIKEKKKFPPKTHNLFFLFNQTGLKLNNKTKTHLGKLMNYQLEGRYPEIYFEIPSKKEINDYLNNTEELLKWLISQL